MLLACLLVLTLLVAVAPIAAQGGDSFPDGAGDAIILYPDVIQDAPASGMTQQRYILLAKTGNILSVTATMAEPGLIARVELADASGVALLEAGPDAAAPNTVLLSYPVVADGWYFVNVNLAVATAQPSAYTMKLTGTTPEIYGVLGLDAPPPVPNAHLITSTAQVGGELGTTAMSYMIPLAEGDGLTLSAQGPSNPRLRFTQFEGGTPAQSIIAEAPQAGGAAIYSFTSTAAQWVRVDVEPAQPGAFSLAVAMPRASGTVADVGAASVSLGESCNGVPARFVVGEMIIVSPEGDNLLLLQDYTDPSTSVALAVRGDIFEILDPPVCHTTPYGEDSWFWEVFSFDDSISGWVQDGLAGEYWICAQNNPACNQATVCAAESAGFAVGDTVIVSQTGDNLQIARYAGATDQVIALAVWNDELEVLAEPVCYYSAWHGGGLWYWQIYSTVDDTVGWVVEGVDDEIWLCPAANPTCDQ
ncbi:MAG: hypothetical protein K8S97_06370 [Anaerolineae bacterium]|nr:hypothetical protein [Anaerolineae bacterium]